MVRKASLLIAEAFDERDIKYTIREIGEETSVVDAGFSITCGPSAHILFASSDEENDVAVRITGLMQNIPSDKRPAMNEACNTVNDKMRYLKFCIHGDNLIGEYDLPAKISDECLAECCVEIFVRAIQILHMEYHFFPEAIYRETYEGKENTALKLLSAIQELKKNPVPAPEEKNDH